MILSGGMSRYVNVCIIYSFCSLRWKKKMFYKKKNKVIERINEMLVHQSFWLFKQNYKLILCFISLHHILDTE